MSTATYEQLLANAVPAYIESERQYQATGEQLGELIGRGPSRTPEESRLMRLLMILVEDYDRRHAMPPEDWSPAEKIQFLLEHSGKKQSDPAAIFGQKSHVSEALNGKRSISADQARKLGKLFSVKPGLFL